MNAVLVSRWLVTAAVVIQSFLLPVVASASDTAYEITSSGQLGVIDLNTGAFTSIGNMGVTLIGLGAFGESLYGVQSSTLYRVNPADGSTTLVGSAAFNYRGFGSTTTGLYGFDQDMGLYSVDPTTGAAILVGPTGLANPSGFGVSTGSDSLYITPTPAAGCSGTLLYSVDTTTGTATLIGDTGICGSGASVFVNGVLYAGVFSPLAVYTLDTNVGTGSFVANVSGTSNDFYGLAPIGSSPWTLVWSDEFDGDDGSAPDPNNWTYDIGMGTNGWGNHELEYYTDRSPDNVVILNGNLVVTALKETYTDPNGITRDYTSARLKTQNRLSFKYGRFEARIKIPYGQGLWPAFWMLGDNIVDVGWPTCGEIDIMENIGREPSTVHGTIHGPGYSGGSGISALYTLPAGQRFADDFHIFAVEWEPGVIRFYVDDVLYKTTTPADLPSGTTWVFDHPFFLILNVAVGGDWPGSPDSTTIFPQTMLVDYVRVYQRGSS